MGFVGDKWHLILISENGDLAFKFAARCHDMIAVLDVIHPEHLFILLSDIQSKNESFRRKF